MNKPTYIIKVKIGNQFHFYGKYKSLEDAIQEYEILRENDAIVKIYEFTIYNKYIDLHI